MEVYGSVTPNPKVGFLNPSAFISRTSSLYTVVSTRKIGTGGFID